MGNFNINGGIITYNYQTNYQTEYIIPTFYHNMYGSIYSACFPAYYTISILSKDDEENEFDLSLCCARCANINFHLSEPQFSKLLTIVKRGDIIIVPDNVVNIVAFVANIEEIAILNNVK